MPMTHKIGILSDTHNLLRPAVTDILSTCDAILHGGDFSAPHILSQLTAIAPVYAVRGNTDTDKAFDRIPQTLSLEVFGIRIFLIHNRQMIQTCLRDRDLIVYGHSHKYEHVQTNGQTWLNPGSCGRKRFLLPLTMAVLTIEENGTFQIEKIQFEKIQIENNQIQRAKSIQAEPSSLPPQKDLKQIVLRVMKETDHGKPVSAIAQSCGISQELAEQVCRLYLTHPGVSADGILGKMGV
ncbi:MAG: metallophosphatase family protein [Eubacterium sp.]|nr:metallophosphatase family protein [Eubacterium sp.]